MTYFIMSVCGIAIYLFVMRFVTKPDSLLSEDELIKKYDLTPRQAHEMRRGMRSDERDHARTVATAIRTANRTARILKKIR